MPPLAGGDIVAVRNKNTKKWDEYGTVVEVNLHKRCCDAM